MEWEPENLAFLAGIIVGSLLLIAVGWVWLTKQVCGVGGLGLGVIGVGLVGLTIWRTITLEISEEGITARFETLEKKIDGVQQEVKATTDVSLAAASELNTLISQVNANQEQFVALTRELASGPAIPGPRLDEIRETISGSDRPNQQKLKEAMQVFEMR